MSRVSITVLAVFLNACLARCLSVNVTRSQQDFIDISPLGGCSHCAKLKQATCSLRKSHCRCTKTHSTFVMYNQTCVSSSGLVKGKFEFFNQAALRLKLMKDFNSKVEL